MAKYVCALLILASLATLVAPSALLQSDDRFLARSSYLRGKRSARGGLNFSSTVAIPPLVPVGPKTPIKFLISSFQDGERCANTLFQALAKAEHPERLFFNVLQAVGPRDPTCHEEFRRNQVPKLCQQVGGDADACRRSALGKVRFQSITLQEGQGPVHQRGLLSEFADLSGEGAMCLATDSHMDFVQHWDRLLLQDWEAADNEFAVLSAYPFGTSQLDLAGPGNWVELCGYFLTNQEIPRGATARPVLEGRAAKDSPQLTMNWAAGQSFARCHAERNVPVDKNLIWMFDGEEVNRAVRFWTNGYDLYNPRVSAVLHNYSAAVQKFWSYSRKDMPEKRKASEARLKDLLQGNVAPDAYGKYGLGDQRSLEEYVSWARTNLGGKWGAFLKSKGMEPHFDGFVQEGSIQPQSVADFCSHLQRAPVRDAQLLAKSAEVTR